MDDVNIQSVTDDTECFMRIDVIEEEIKIENENADENENSSKHKNKVKHGNVVKHRNTAEIENSAEVLNTREETKASEIIKGAANKKARSNKKASGKIEAVENMKATNKIKLTENRKAAKKKKATEYNNETENKQVINTSNIDRKNAVENKNDMTRVPCPYCLVTFARRCDLNRHLKEVQCRNISSERQIGRTKSCNVCLKAVHPRNLKRHMKNLHDVDIPTTLRREPCVIPISRRDSHKLDVVPILKSLPKASLSSICYVCGQAVKQGCLNQHLVNVHNIINEVIHQQSLPQAIQPMQLPVSARPSDESLAIGPGNVVDEPLPVNLLQLLPSDYQYRLFEYDKEELSSDSFTTSFTVNVHNQAQFTEWKQSFQSKTRTQYTISNTATCAGDYLLFKQYLKCVHNKRQKNNRCIENKSQDKKGQRNGAACPARLTVTIRFQSLGLLPCQIDLFWDHNHPIIDDQILRHHLVTPATKEKLVDLYNHGHSPSSALLCIYADIEDSIKDEHLLHIALADRSIFPDVFYCHYIFNRVFKKKFGNPRNTSRLVEYINELNNEHGENTVMQEEYDGKHLIAICTPLMKRIHEKVEEVGELMFVDSSVRFNWKRYRIFLFTTHSKAGVIPLAVGITPSDSIEALTRLFNLIKQVLPENAFYLRGRDQGPQLVMTDDSSTEQTALQNVWPQTQLFLSQFHVLQSTWRYLLLEENGIAATDRPALFALVKNIMYAQTHQDLCAQYELFLTSPALTNYRNFEDHIRRLYESKGRMWCSAFRTGLSVIDIYTSNSVEYQFRILKDQIFKRTNTFNIVQMTHFITDRLSSYYERRLLDYSSNRLQHQPLKLALEERIDTLSEDVFEIMSNDNPAELYTVNIATCMCTCKDGSTGKLCKHVHYIQAQAELNSCSNEPADNREVMYFVACGYQPPAGWQDKLSNSMEQPTTSELVAPPFSEANNNSVSDGDYASDTDGGFKTDDVSDNFINVSPVTTDNLIKQQLIETEQELIEVFHSTVDRHIDRNPLELLAACRTFIDTLKSINVADPS